MQVSIVINKVYAELIKYVHVLYMHLSFCYVIECFNNSHTLHAFYKLFIIFLCQPSPSSKVCCLSQKALFIRLEPAEWK